MIHSGIPPLLTSPLQFSSDNSTLLFKTEREVQNAPIAEPTAINTNRCTLMFSSAFSNSFPYLYGLAAQSLTTNIRCVISMRIMPVPGPFTELLRGEARSPQTSLLREWCCRDSQLNLLSLLCLETGNAPHRVKSSPGSILRQHCWLKHLLHRAFKGLIQNQ